METSKTQQRIGNGLNYFMSIVLIISGILKLVKQEGYMEVIKDLNMHYYDNIYLIGFVTLISGMLFAIPRTYFIGFIATLVFLGGTISAHMQHGDPYIAQIGFVVITVLSAFFKRREWFLAK